MKKDELKKRYDIICDAWEFLKKYSTAEDTDAYWERVIDDGNAIVFRNGKTEFSIKIMSAVICELGNIAKENDNV